VRRPAISLAEGWVTPPQLAASQLLYVLAEVHVSRVTPVHTAVRNCTIEGGPFELGNQVLISSHRKLLSSKAMVVNVAEKSELDFGRYD
jgi:hypothetical protein